MSDYQVGVGSTDTDSNRKCRDSLLLYRKKISPPILHSPQHDWLGKKEYSRRSHNQAIYRNCNLRQPLIACLDRSRERLLPQGHKPTYYCNHPCPSGSGVVQSTEPRAHSKSGHTWDRTEQGQNSDGTRQLHTRQRNAYPKRQKDVPRQRMCWEAEDVPGGRCGRQRTCRGRARQRMYRGRDVLRQKEARVT